MINPTELTDIVEVSESTAPIAAVALGIKAIPDETLNNIYNDTFHPLASEIGDLVSKPIHAVNWMLDALGDKVKTFRENNTLALQAAVNENVVNIPAERLTEPDLNIAAPAVMANSCTDSVFLRELYRNLITKTMDTNYKNMVHPAFIEIIRQLSPLEALFMKTTTIMKTMTPACKIRYQAPVRAVFPNQNIDIIKYSSTGFDILTHYIKTDFNAEQEEISLMIENLERLRLIHTDYDSYMVDAKHYRQFEKDDIGIRYTHSTEKDKELAYIPGYIEPTSFGKRFYDICVREI